MNISITFRDQLGQITIVNIKNKKVEVLGTKWCTGLLIDKNIIWQDNNAPTEKDLKTLYRLLNNMAFL